MKKNHIQFKKLLFKCPMFTLPFFFMPTTAVAHPPMDPTSLTNRHSASEPVYYLFPIGKVEITTNTTPRIRIYDTYKDGLLGLENWSHIYVIWWFDANDTPERRSRLQVHPMGNTNNPLTGVFACRSPVRPNLIGLTICKVEKVDPPYIYIDKIDAWPETPVLDIKPVTKRETNLEVHGPVWEPRHRDNPTPQTNKLGTLHQ